eukprot:jgi/Mesen1/9231/ME000595S08644
MAESGVPALLGAGAAGLAAGVALTLAVAKLPTIARFLPKQSAKIGPRPHPEWRPGEEQRPPFDMSKTIEIDPGLNGPSVLYPLTISTVVPRPIAFISSLSKAGVGNLSPYSYFNAVAHDPPILAIGHCWSKGRPKDSLQNILETEEFVVSIISEWFVEAANHTCGAYGSDVDEMELARLTPLPSLKVKAPRIGESAINMECKLRHSYDVKNSKGEVTTTVVLGEVVMFHIAEHVASRSPNSGKVIVDPTKLKAMSRLGGNTYGHVTSLFDIPRPDQNGCYAGDANFSQSERDKLLKKSS